MTKRYFKLVKLTFTDYFMELTIQKRYKKILYRKYFAQNEKYKILMQWFFINKLFEKEITYVLKYTLENIFKKTSSIAFFKNTCVSTGRARGILRILKVSRITIRNLYKLYKISGLKRASW